MQHNEILFRKRREFAEIISDSFEFLKQEIKPLSRLIIIYVLPLIVLYAAGQVYMQRNVFSKVDLSDQEMLMNNIGPFYLNLFVFMFFGIFIQSLLIGTFYSYVEVYIKKGKGNFNINDISANLFNNSLLALGAGFVYAIIVFFGMMMCFAPGIYFANTFSLAIFIIIYQKQGLSHALARSWKLVNTQWWNTLALNLVGLIIVLLVNMLFSIPGLLMDATNNLPADGQVNLADYPKWYWILSGISTAVNTILLIIPVTFQVFQYFNLEERETPTVLPE